MTTATETAGQAADPAYRQWINNETPLIVRLLTGANMEAAILTGLDEQELTFAGPEGGIVINRQAVAVIRPDHMQMERDLKAEAAWQDYCAERRRDLLTARRQCEGLKGYEPPETEGLDKPFIETCKDLADADIPLPCKADISRWAGEPEKLTWGDAESDLFKGSYKPYD